MKDKLIVGCLLGCALSVGCVENSYDRAGSSIDHMMARYAMLTQATAAPAGGALVQTPSAGDVAAKAPASPESTKATKLPWAQAKFCLDRASSNLNNAKTSNSFDTLMLVAAGLTGGVGSASYAASTQVDDADRKSSWGQVGGITIAATAALLGLRTALDLGNVAKEQRTAAADQAEAAVIVLEQAALQIEAPGADAHAAWHACTEGERRVAQVLARAGAAEAIKKAIDEAKDRESEAQAKQEAAEKKRAEAIAAAPPVALADPVRAADAKKKSAEADVKEAEADVLLAKARVAEARAEVLKAGSQLRRAILYYTEFEVDASMRELIAAQAQVKDALKVVDDKEKAVKAATAKERSAEEEYRNALPKR